MQLSHLQKFWWVSQIERAQYLQFSRILQTLPCFWRAALVWRHCPLDHSLTCRYRARSTQTDRQRESSSEWSPLWRTLWSARMHRTGNRGRAAFCESQISGSWRKQRLAQRQYDRLSCHSEEPQTKKSGREKWTRSRLRLMVSSSQQEKSGKFTRSHPSPYTVYELVTEKHMHAVFLRLSPLGSYFFNTTFWGGAIQGGGGIQEGELFFQCHLFTFERTKFISNHCKTKLFRSKNDTVCVHDELPGELFK